MSRKRSDEDGFPFPGSLEQARVAVIGLGLMGGSLALALQGKCAALFGIDRDPAVLSQAAELSIFDKVSAEVENTVSLADLVVLATPVKTILELLKALPALHPGRAVVLDLGSTKSEICRVMETLPDRFDPIGGHPMAGKEKTGLVHAESSLFTGRPFVLSALTRTTQHACQLAQALCESVGAIPLWLEPTVHDRLAAATSHVPYLVSSALAGATPEEAAVLVGPGFQSTTRIAATNPEIMLDILETNREEILRALGKTRVWLEEIESTLRDHNYTALKEQLSQSASHLHHLSNQ